MHAAVVLSIMIAGFKLFLYKIKLQASESVCWERRIGEQPKLPAITTHNLTHLSLTSPRPARKHAEHP